MNRSLALCLRLRDEGADARIVTTELVPPPSPPFYYAEEHHQQYRARPEASPYCTAQPLLISLPRYDTWGPTTLGEASCAPKLPEAFWDEHAPEEHCALRRPHAQILL